MLRLNLPPELAQRVLATTIIGLIVLALLGWWAFDRVVASSAPPTIKIGLVAPFEGLYRQTGYDVLFAVKLAIHERNQGNGLNGHRVELVALNDFNEPAEAVRQAKALAVDPGIMGVVGHLTPETTLAALPVYQAAHLAVVAPWSVTDAAFDFPNLVSVAATAKETRDRLQAEMRAQGLEQTVTLAHPGDPIPPGAQALVLETDAVTAGNILLDLPPEVAVRPKFGQVETGDRQLVQTAGPAAEGLVYVSAGPGAAELAGGESFSQAYQALAGYPPPPRATLAYEATQVLLDSIEKTINIDNRWYNNPSGRSGVNKTLTAVERAGLTGNIRFDADGRRIDAPVWLYQITEVRYPGKRSGRQR